MPKKRYFVEVFRAGKADSLNLHPMPAPIVGFCFNNFQAEQTNTY